MIRYEHAMTNKIIAIIGPTSSGKSDLAIILAKKYHGEIISADSRQIYRGMNLGTGKVTQAKQQMAKHHMLDIVSPRTTYNVAKFVKTAQKITKEIYRRGHVPLVCGGTGFWMQALLENQTFPPVPPDNKLRTKLHKKTARQLFSQLNKLDPLRAKTIDAKNSVRLIRAIEIAKVLGKVPLLKSQKQTNNSLLVLGIQVEKDALYKRIKKRLMSRFKQGMITEVKRLHAQGVSWVRLERFGLEYKWIALFLQKKITEKEMRENLFAESKKFAKRQMTWLKRWEKQGQKIHWVNNVQEAQRILKGFL